jgi:hypothetical protein
MQHNKYPNHQLVYHACDMVLHIQSDASFLSRSESRSVAGGVHYLGNKDEPLQVHGPLLACPQQNHMLCYPTSSAAEAEYGACFMNAQQGAWLRTVLKALGYAQPATRILCDNQ